MAYYSFPFNISNHFLRFGRMGNEARPPKLLTVALASSCNAMRRSVKSCFFQGENVQENVSTAAKDNEKQILLLLVTCHWPVLVLSFSHNKTLEMHFPIELLLPATSTMNHERDCEFPRTTTTKISKKKRK